MKKKWLLSCLGSVGQRKKGLEGKLRAMFEKESYGYSNKKTSGKNVEKTSLPPLNSPEIDEYIENLDQNESSVTTTTTSKTTSATCHQEKEGVVKKPSNVKRRKRRVRRRKLKRLESNKEVGDGDATTMMNDKNKKTLERKK